MKDLRDWLERRGKWALPASALAVAALIEIALEILYEATAGDREGGLTSAPLFWAAFGFAAVCAAAALARLAVRAGLIRERGYYGGDDERKGERDE